MVTTLQMSLWQMTWQSLTFAIPFVIFLLWFFTRKLGNDGNVHTFGMSFAKKMEFAISFASWHMQNFCYLSFDNSKCSTICHCIFQTKNGKCNLFRHLPFHLPYDICHENGKLHSSRHLPLHLPYYICQKNGKCKSSRHLPYYICLNNGKCSSLQHLPHHLPCTIC